MPGNSWTRRIGIIASAAVIGGAVLAPAAMAAPTSHPTASVSMAPNLPAEDDDEAQPGRVTVDDGSLRVGDRICAGNCNGSANGTDGTNGVTSGGICAGLCNGSANGGNGTTGGPGRDGTDGGKGGICAGICRGSANGGAGGNGGDTTDSGAGGDGGSGGDGGVCVGIGCRTD